MNNTIKTLKSGFSMPAIGKGTWMAGTKKKTYTVIGLDARIKEIKDTIAKGITYIDTAERYADGYGEQIVGDAIKGIEREKLFITSKLSSKHLNYDTVVLAAKRTLNRLGATYLDIYFIHRYDTRVSLKETMRAMDFLISEKKIKYIGVCNFTKDQLIEAQSFTKNKIVANQVKYNYLSREASTNGTIEYCQENDIMVIAWRPYPQDLLTESTTSALEKLSQKYKKSVPQIANAWLMQQKNIVVLAKLGTDTELQETKDSLSIKFDQKDTDAMMAN